MPKLFYADGQSIKNILLPQYPDAAWNFYSEPPPDISAELYAGVAAVYRAMNLNAQAVASLPFALVKGGQDYDTSDEWQNKVKFMPRPRELFRLLRLSLGMHNQAYLFREKPAGTLDYKLRYIVPSTITPIQDKQNLNELLGFKRTVGAQSRDYLFSENSVFYPIVYLWRLDHTTELLPSKNTEYKALSAAAGVQYYSDFFTRHFFERGGIKPTILTVKGVPSEAAKNEMEKIWDKVIRGYYKFLAKVFNAEVVTPVTIGEGIENLKDTELYKQKLSDIAMATGIPLSLLLANSANYATAQTEQKQWFDQTVTPWAEFIADELNEQVFTPIGLRLEFRPEVSDPGQEDETSRAGAYQSYVNAGMRPSIAAQVVGIELPPGVEYDALDEKFDQPEPEPEAPGDQPATDDEDDEPEPPAKFIPTLEQYREMELWQTMAFRKLKRAEPMAFHFDVKTLPDAVAWDIRTHIEDAKTEDDIRAAFDFGGMEQPNKQTPDFDSAALTAELKRANDLLERTLNA